MKHTKAYIAAVLALALFFTACDGAATEKTADESDTTTAAAVIPGESAAESTPVSTQEAATTTDVKIHDPEEAVTDWQTALAYLNQGNTRYVSNKAAQRSSDALRSATKAGQKPFAIVITCADSRDIPELYFDESVGDVFTIRVAGNIQDESVLGSVRYAVEHLNVPLIAVVGHTHCGAVTAAVTANTPDTGEAEEGHGASGEEEGETPADLKYIIDTIISNVTTFDRNNIEAAAEENAEAVANVLRGEFGEEAHVIDGIYDIESGVVTWHEADNNTVGRDGGVTAPSDVYVTTADTEADTTADTTAA